MKLIIRSFAMIREIIGEKSKVWETQLKKLEEILNELIIYYPELKMHLRSGDIWNKAFVYAVNGERVVNNRLIETIIKEGDEIAIIPPAGGG